MKPALLRQPRRLSITVSASVHQSLLDHSGQQGRSLSNLAAYLLEQALTELLPNKPVRDRGGTPTSPLHIDRTARGVGENCNLSTFLGNVIKRESETRMYPH